MEKKTWYWIIGIFLIFVTIGNFIPEENYSSESKLKLGEPTYPSNTESSSQTENELTPPSTESSLSDNLEEQVEEETQEQSNYLQVTYIVDGDTLDISTGERVRLICIDTPERGEFYYSEAKDYLKSLTLNKEVELIKDISETDRYGRLLRYIYLIDGTFVNELIVKNGYAKAYPYGSDITLCPQIQEAEQYAKDNNLGIWAEEEEEEQISEDYICSYNYYNCGDFNSQSEAQEVFNYCKSQGKGDIHKLDRDNDNIPCESLS